jgi:PAS domain S-box-containing protein
VGKEKRAERTPAGRPPGAESSSGLSAAALEHALESAGVGTWHWERTSGAVWWSPVTARLFGEEGRVSLADFAAYLEFIHPEDRAMTTEAVERAMASPSGEFAIEHRIVTKAGVVRWIEGRGRAERDASGATVRFVGTCHDISARKQTEISLAEERRFMASVLDTVSALVVVLSMDMSIRAFSRACEVATGWKESEVLGRSFVDLFVLESEKAGVRATFAQLAAGDFPNQHENFWRRRDGSLSRIAWSNTSILDEAGNVRFVIGTGIDVTESRRIQQALRSSEERLELSLEASGLGTWDFEVASDRLTCDERCASMLGFVPSELTKADDYRAILHPDDAPVVERAFTAHLDGRAALFEAEQRLRSKSGSYGWYLTRGRIVSRDDSGAPARIAGTLLEINEKKFAEAQALRAQRLESLGMIAGGIAHDLNNTLTPTLMAVDSLRQEHPALANDELVELIEQGAVRAAGLVQQVLQYARGAEGLLAPFPKNLRIALEVADPLPTVMGDPTQLQQVLMNLSVNARDAMPSGGELRIRAEAVTIDLAMARQRRGLRAGHWVRLEVSDTGSGIPPHHLEHVFDPFFTTKEPGKGTGLGLPTVLAIVRRLEGFVLIDSRVGQGTVVEAYFPACDEAPNSATQVPPHRLRGHQELVLVVDDEGPIRILATRTLEANGYRVISASDGAEAMALFYRRRGDVRVVVTDLMMPNADGASVVRAIREIDASLPIIAMSGLPVGDHLPAPARVGIAAFLPKPFSSAALLEAVQRALAATEREQRRID